MRYFTSDTHFGHVGIIKFGKRPWATVEEMNAGLIANWNSTVSKKDEVFVIGDFAWRGSKGALGGIFHQLNGSAFYLIKGNHDDKEVLTLPWSGVFDYKEINENGHKVTMSHYPMRSWNKMFSGSYHFHGHEHGNVVDFSHHDNSVGKGGSCDVGVDCWNWTPRTFEEIVERIKTNGRKNPDLYDAEGNDRTIRKTDKDT